MEGKPARVPGQPDKQAGEIRARWAWVEPSVWTDRMLAALENGVKGGKWFSLIDKVYSMANLRAAWESVRSNRGAAGVDGQSIELFEKNAEKHLQRLAEQLEADTYEPQPVRRSWIEKPGSSEKRPLGIPAVRDRVAQTALRNVLEPIFENGFAPRSYGFRPGRGCKDALREVDRLLKDGSRWVLDADLKGYFDSIPHDQLTEAVQREVSDGRIIDLLEKYLTAGVMEGAELWRTERGTPQGAVISPLLANLYLDPLDHMMAEAGYQMVRYADDFVILCRSEAEARQARERVREFAEAHGLRLHPEKTRLVDATQKGGFDFLGYHFERGYRWPRPKSEKKLKDSIRSKTRRTDGRSLQAVICDVNRTLRGWFGYFKHAHWTTFRPLDGWVRMRLRSILRKRRGGQGRGGGRDHHRWPNAHFARLGLYSLEQAHAEARQSL
ncbi:MAG: group II intron reverse transcriptase/maturase [Candidatus Brocadiia bacterium]